MPKKWKVKLRSDQRKKLLRIVRAGKHKAREILYAHILLKAAKGWSDANIADAFATSTKTVQRTRQRFVAAGLHAALTEGQRPGQPAKLTPEQEILLIALACSTPPAGFQRWTIRLLTSEAIARQIVPEIVPETARQILKNELKPWQVENWCHADITPAFIACMKDVVTLYAQPYDPARPTVCFDEQPVQLLADARPGRPLARGYPRRRDYEYVRRGTRNLFLFVEPKIGQRRVLATRRRTKEDFAKAMRYLVDEMYPQIPVIDVVLDHLNTHAAETLIEIFGKVEADRLLAHLVFHYTPLHASWLNIAEIVLSALTRQCLDRRIGDEWTLMMEILAWEYRRNAEHQPIAWSFDWKRARRFVRDHKRRQRSKMGTGQN